MLREGCPLDHWSLQNGSTSPFDQMSPDFTETKMLQLIPGIGAAVGALVNHRLTMKLGKTAMNAYRMRWNGSKELGDGKA